MACGSTSASGGSHDRGRRAEVAIHKGQFCLRDGPFLFSFHSSTNLHCVPGGKKKMRALPRARPKSTLFGPSGTTTDLSILRLKPRPPTVRGADTIIAPASAQARPG